MARIKYAARTWQDLERIFEFYAGEDPKLAHRIVSLVIEAVEVLAAHPLIGRHAERGLRELVISSGRTGFVALYRYRDDHEIVRILAIRHQREAGLRRL
ncbi:MAG: type II toxin-antitoxin system RelE/ParE family toxin [Pseudomonadota bacterium]